MDQPNQNSVGSVNAAVCRKRREGFSPSGSRPVKRKITLLIALILINSLCAFAQDAKKFAVGLGLEWNMNSRDNFAGGAVLGLDFNLPKSLALGLTVTTNYNFDGIVVIEPAALFRWYFLSMEKEDAHSGLFAQADIGAYLVIEDGETTPLFLGGLRGGFRFPAGEMFFIEPYGRIGYPFAFGIGVTAGIKF